MTNEEAIKILKEEILGLSEDNPFYEAVDLATKALEQDAKTDICKRIIKKIDLILPGISDSSKRDMDLIIAQTVQALSEAYKNLKDDLSE